MTTLIIKVDDEDTESLKKILNDIPYVKNIAIEKDINLSEPSTQYQKIKNILEDARGKNLFHDIKDPVEWQREIRKEWDRDL
jgi:Xaa-Pro aminopeptidase